MSDVFAQVKKCNKNRLPTLIYVVSFGTTCLSLLIEAREAVMNASQDCDFKLHNLTVTESKFFFSRLDLAGSDNLITIYHCRVVTILMTLSPAHQAGW